MAIKGHLYKLQIDIGSGTPQWTSPGKQQDGTFSLSVETTDTSNKDDNGAASHIPVQYSGSLQVSGMALPDDPVLEFIEDKILALEQFDVKWLEGVTGGREFTAKASCETIDYEAANNDTVKYSLSLMLSGVITRTDPA